MGGGVVYQRLLPTHKLRYPHQFGDERNSTVSSHPPPKESLVGQGGPNLHCPFHCPLPGIRNVLLYGYSEEFLCLPLLLPVLLRFPIHAFPILVRFCHQDISVDYMMAVRVEVWINEVGHG